MVVEGPTEDTVVKQSADKEPGRRRLQKRGTESCTEVSDPVTWCDPQLTRHSTAGGRGQGRHGMGRRHGTARHSTGNGTARHGTAQHGTAWASGLEG